MGLPEDMGTFTMTYTEMEEYLESISITPKTIDNMVPAHLENCGIKCIVTGQ